MKGTCYEFLFLFTRKFYTLYNEAERPNIKNFEGGINIMADKIFLVLLMLVIWAGVEFLNKIMGTTDDDYRED